MCKTISLFCPECLAFLRELKDKKLSSDQKTKKNKMVAALDELLKSHQQGATANGLAGGDGGEEGDVYLPMDEDTLQTKQKEPESVDEGPQQEMYEPMTADQLDLEKPASSAPLEGDDEYMNPDGDRPLEEVEQEEYEDVESALGASRNFLSSGKEDGSVAVSPALSPSPSTENVSEKARKKRNLPFGRSKKKSSETADAVPMPDPSTAQLSGNLEYRVGRVGRFTKQWVVLEGGCLFIGKSQEEEEAIRLVSVNI